MIIYQTVDIQFHAMTTNVAAGAGQAMEVSRTLFITDGATRNIPTIKDAYILGHLLSHPLSTIDTVATSLKVYEDMRLDFANRIISNSRDIGLMYEFNGPIYDGRKGVSQEVLDEWGKAICERWEFQWTGSPAEELQQATAQLEAQLM